MKMLFATVAALFLVSSQAQAAGGEKLVFSPTAFEAERNLVLQDRNYSNYIAKGMMKKSDMGIALVDLDGDGMPEIFSYTENSLMCGSLGCMLEVHKKTASGLKMLFRITAYNDVRISSHTHHGMKDIILHDGTGQSHTWAFSGAGYMPKP